MIFTLQKLKEPYKTINDQISNSTANLKWSKKKSQHSEQKQNFRDEIVDVKSLTRYAWKKKGNVEENRNKKFLMVVTR